jgi:hypothetical protein
MALALLARRCSGIRTALVVSCLALTACTIQSGLPGPRVTFDTPLGPVPLDAPPANVPPPGQPVHRDGTYAGRAEVLSTAGGLCLHGINMTGFRVSGDSVQFGRFHGTITPEGGLQMVYRGTWIIGQFEGATFSGQIDGAGNWDMPGCTFYVALNWTGP